jgi:4-amino-4-deoxy-L-arabinose transferase-like glycosyltransferase
VRGASQALGPTLALLSLWLVATLFNATKAVHVDDSTYLIIARQILAEPLHPMSGDLSLAGSRVPIASTNQPPGLFYGFAAVMALFGESELALHLFVALFSAVAIVAFHRLARSLCREHALPLTAGFCLGPAFLPAQNLMTDVPLVALWLVFFWLLIDRSALPTPGARHVGAAAVLGAACMIKYTSLALLPLLAGALAASGQRRRLWALLIPLATLAAWSLFNTFDYGGVHLLDRETELPALASLGKRSIDWLIGLGAVTPLSLLFFPWALRHRRAAAGIALLVLVAVLLQRQWSAAQQPLHPALAAGFFANGTLLVLLTGASTAELLRERRNAALLLGGWIAAAAGFVVLLAPFMAVRHVLLALPAVLLLVARLVRGAGARAWVGAASALSVGLGVVLAASDWAWADVYRTQASALRARFGADTPVWYVGTWGWRWYAEAAGMRAYLPGTSRLRDGDIVVRASVRAGPRALARRDAARAQVFGVVPIPHSRITWLRTMRPQPEGGYYGFESPGVPWMPSEAPLEEFEILRIHGD